MTKKLITTLSIILLLGSTPITGVSANSNIDIRELNLPQPFAVKKEATYNEAKDPFLRKGTENEEESQVSFFHYTGCRRWNYLPFYAFQSRIIIVNVTWSPIISQEFPTIALVNLSLNSLVNELKTCTF